MKYFLRIIIIGFVCVNSLFITKTIAQDFRVISLNAWFSPTDWDIRYANMVQMLTDLQPDIVGLQENNTDFGLSVHQSVKIIEALPQYTEISSNGDKSNAILYLKDKYSVVETGISYIAPSANWRHIWWVLFVDMQGNHFYAYNTHWNHVDAGYDSWMTHARNTITLMKNRSHPEYPAFITGDFNTLPTTSGNLYLRGELAGEANDYPLRDTWQDANGSSYVGAGSYGSLKAGKIDYVFVPEDEWTVLDAWVIPKSEDVPGHTKYYVSDHLAVITIFRSLDPTAPYIELSQDTDILEGSENGSIINVKLINDIFTNTLDESYWTIGNLPEGVFVDTIIRINDTLSTITLSGNSILGSYTSDITNFSVTIDSIQFNSVDYDLDASMGVLLKMAPFAIPGRIKAESYHDMKGIKLESCSDIDSDQDVGDINLGDWLEFKVDVTQSGTYAVNIRIAAYEKMGILRILMDDTIIGIPELPITGGWQTWETSYTEVELKEGEQTLKLYAIRDGFNINWIEFVTPSEEPRIFNIIALPEDPKSDEEVIVSTTVVDDINLSDVVLNWGTSSSTLDNQITMSGDDNTYSVNIPNQPFGTTIYYQIEATDNNTNTTSSNTYSYLVNNYGSGVEKQLTQDELRIFPNPSNTNIISLECNNTIDNIELVDVHGKTVNRYTVNQRSFEINTDSFSHGLYIEKITSNHRTFNKKIIIE